MAAVIDAQSLLHLCLKVTAEEGCQTRQAPGGASHFEGGWVGGGGGGIQGRRAKSAARSNMSFCQSSLVWTVFGFFHKWLRISVTEGGGRGAFELPCETPIFVLQLTHRQADPWRKNKFGPELTEHPTSALMCRVVLLHHSF